MFSVYLPYFDKLVFHPFFLPVLVLFVILYYKTFSSNSKNNAKILPPSPPKLPIIGNLHQLGLLPHRSLQSLSQKYGKLMLLKLGSKQALVVSSVDAAREIMRTNDVNFSNRPKSRASSRLFSNGKDVAFAPYGDSWRKLKSMFVIQLLSNKKVESFRRIREEETHIVVEKLNISSSSSSVIVNLTEMVRSYAFDVTCRVSFGRKYSKNHDNNFEDSITEALKLLGEFFLGDFVPGLSWIDRLTGLEGRLEKVAQQLDSFLEKAIHEQQTHLNTKKNIEDKSFVDILLEDDDLALDSIKAVVLDMFAAGVDTIYTLIEWVIVELLRHPEEMRQVEEEVRKQMKGKGRRINDDDLKDLNYLKAVIKEALRMHPPVPLLVFRESLKDTKVNGFDIDAETLVIINAWAIQNDPVFWEEPEEFRPERFMNDGGSSSSIDFKGQDFQYIPFGSGRRSCPGISFAMAKAELMIATLMFEFDLKLPDYCKMLDMTEILGITVRRRDPLMIVATPRAF